VSLNAEVFQPADVVIIINAGPMDTYHTECEILWRMVIEACAEHRVGVLRGASTLGAGQNVPCVDHIKSLLVNFLIL
jgi:hypothetical protein